MISLTFGEQVKIVLSRKDMTIKEKMLLQKKSKQEPGKRCPVRI